MTTPLRIGILGAGEVAARHVAGLLASGVELQLVAIADPIIERARELAARFGFERATADVDGVLATDEMDAVVILTPHHLHAPQAVRALDLGLHVICEKPMATTVAECDAMLAAAQRNGRRVFVTHTLRSEMFFVRSLEALSSGRIGRPTLASFRWYTDEAVRLENPEHWKGTIDRAGGGVLLDGGCHVADAANALFGRPLRVEAFGARLVARREGLGEDTAAFAVEYASGTLATFACSFVAGAGLRPRRFACGLDMDIYATEGHLEGGYRIRETAFRRYLREHRTGEPDIDHIDDGIGTTGDIDGAILRALVREEAPPVTAVDARNAVAVVEAAYRSIASGAAEKVDWSE